MNSWTHPIFVNGLILPGVFSQKKNNNKAGDLELECQISPTLNLRGRGNKRSEIYEPVFVNQYLRRIMNIRWTDSVWKDNVGQTRHYGKDGSWANQKTDHEWQVGENWPNFHENYNQDHKADTLMEPPGQKKERAAWVELDLKKSICNWTSMDT